MVTLRGAGRKKEKRLASGPIGRQARRSFRALRVAASHLRMNSPLEFSSGIRGCNDCCTPNGVPSSSIPGSLDDARPKEAAVACHHLRRSQHFIYTADAPLSPPLPWLSTALRTPALSPLALLHTGHGATGHLSGPHRNSGAHGPHVVPIFICINDPGIMVLLCYPRSL
jgi:hypothetical protein